MKSLPVVLLSSCLFFSCQNNEPMTEKEALKEMLKETVPKETVAADFWSIGSAGPVEEGWLKTFQSPELTKVVEEVIANNQDLRSAAATLDAAAHRAIQAGAVLKPQVYASGMGSRRSSGDSVLPAGEADLEERGSYGASLDVAWEIDLWGRLKSRVSGVEADFGARQADYDFARQSLAAQACKGWFLVQESTMIVEVVDEAVGLYRKALRVVEAQAKVGRVSRQDVHLAKSDLASSLELLNRVKSARSDAIRALEVLMGRYPKNELAVLGELQDVPPAPPKGLPAEILERRPDIVAAERRVAAAFHRTEEARTARLPRLTLTSGIGVASEDIGNLNLSDAIWNVGAGLMAPIYTGGALEEQVKIRTAQQKAAAAAYGQTALRAFQEVENGLSNEVYLKKRENFLKTSADENRLALKISAEQYKVGKIDFLSVLQLQGRQLILDSYLINIRSQRLTARVNLHLGLGGEFILPKATEGEEVEK